MFLRSKKYDKIKSLERQVRTYEYIHEKRIDVYKEQEQKLVDKFEEEVQQASFRSKEDEDTLEKLRALSKGELVDKCNDIIVSFLCSQRNIGMAVNDIPPYCTRCMGLLADAIHNFPSAGRKDEYMEYFLREVARFYKLRKLMIDFLEKNDHTTYGETRHHIHHEMIRMLHGMDNLH
ncbi:hypothetical protein [Priestia endophytica]|uniref:Uncharacterized protein n=1 Tax=Priestia endophytica DSM 13796 TaxID=1121089 RepID=A0A1I6C0J6_9BACI|nr:hypothetical protein [Priestia endophytica]KYG33422.1 hypothetical protein AZF06_21495 [Priestia endophytica]SFQ86708.1 hypothetical protein SAMN02745910_04705 [Priestia endophytica DSM 13796]